MKVLISVLGAVLAAMVLAVPTATDVFAHGGLSEGASPWTAWNPTADVVVGSLLIVGIYSNGLRRLRHGIESGRLWRHVSFFAGIGAVFLALQSPIDPIAERNFLVHQVQHLLIRMIGPMLIFLSAPQGTLVAGTPGWVRSLFVHPVAASGVVRGVSAVIAHPVVATAIFIGALYFWQVPAVHNLALLNDYVHYVMHFSLLFAGLLFFWRIFDWRPPPQGTRYGTRLMMLWIMILSNVVIGSFLAFKTFLLYPAYDELGRLWFAPLPDEQLGAVTIWVPNSMMGLLSILIVLHLWGREENKADRRRVAKVSRLGHGWNEPPMTAAQLIAETAPKNRRMALGLAAFVLCVFTAAIMIGVISQMMPV